MSVVSGDIAARAEARRNRILQNAKKRLDKVLSLPDMKETAKPSFFESCKERAVEDISPSQESLLDNDEVTSTEINNIVDGNLKTHLKKIECTLYESNSHLTKLSEQFQPLLNGNQYKERSQYQTRIDPISNDIAKQLEFLGNQTTQSPSKGLKGKQSLDNLYQLQYVLLAIVVRLMLYMQIGWIFGEMIIVPFILTVSIEVSLGHVHNSSFVQILSQVMALCGFSSESVQSFAKANTLVLHCLDNFSLYFVTFCLIHSCLNEEVVSR